MVETVGEDYYDYFIGIPHYLGIFLVTFLL